MAFEGQVAKGVRVYRFHDSVAINFKQKDGYAETVYIPHELAHQFAALVQDGANDITMKGFGSSNLGTMLASVDGEGFVTLEKE